MFFKAQNIMFCAFFCCFAGAAENDDTEKRRRAVFAVGVFYFFCRVTKNIDELLKERR